MKIINLKLERFRDRVEFSGNPSKYDVSVTLRSVQLEDEGIYNCYIMNPPDRHRGHGKIYLQVLMEGEGRVGRAGSPIPAGRPRGALGEPVPSWGFCRLGGLRFSSPAPWGPGPRLGESLPRPRSRSSFENSGFSCVGPLLCLGERANLDVGAIPGHPPKCLRGGGIVTVPILQMRKQAERRSVS